MKIYFSASIRGGREDVEHYANIIEILRVYGQVLTEHLGDKTLTSYGQTTMTDTEIFIKDTKWIHESDIIVAEVTTPSLGVGYEIGYAESLGKRIVAIHRKEDEKRVSAMIAGNSNINLYTYKKIEEIENILKEVFK